MHRPPDPATQDGCTSCGDDLRHGLRYGDRVVFMAPMTARLHGTVTGFALDKADVFVDGRGYPITIHAKWLAKEDECPATSDTAPSAASSTARAAAGRP